jgi:hypothetical protein
MANWRDLTLKQDKSEANWDDLPEQTRAFVPAIYPDTYEFELPKSLENLWEVFDAKNPAAPEGPKVQRVALQFSADSRTLLGVRIDQSGKFSAMTLLRAMDPPVPADVQQAADDLRYRAHITVGLVVPEEFSFPDNWIYINDADVKVGRVQNFGRW